MKKYLDYLKGYEKIGESAENFDDVINGVNDICVPRCDNPRNNAVILLGYSGNGKTTTLRKFISENPSYFVVSIDSLCISFFKWAKRYPTLEELHKIIGELLTRKLGTNFVFDGNFLNLFNRMALCDFLHANGYNVNMIDLIPNLDEIMIHRIMDETDKLIKKSGSGILTEKDYAFYYEVASKRINNFYERERTGAFMAEQEEYDTVHMGADKVYSLNDDMKEIGQISSQQK